MTSDFPIACGLGAPDDFPICFSTTDCMESFQSMPAPLQRVLALKFFGAPVGAGCSEIIFEGRVKLAWQRRAGDALIREISTIWYVPRNSLTSCASNN